MNNKLKSGFSLIELMVVISIIGFIASVILLGVSNARQKARDAKRVADMRLVSTLLENYFNSNRIYPTQASPALMSAALSTPLGVVMANAPYPGDTSTCTAANGSFIWNDYVYTSANGTSYTITFCLGGDTGNYAAGTHTLSPSGIQ